MDQQARKWQVAEAAVEFIDNGSLLGVGTGSTVNCFIDTLAKKGFRLEAAVSSSEATTARLEKHGYRVIDLNEAGSLELYVDGADESNQKRQLIKGGGGALTREKIVAAASDKFLCIVDESKVVDVLGAFPLPVEVIPMARSFIGRKIVALGGRPELRADFVTDNGNYILDVHGLAINDPTALETELNQVAGVVCVGLFANRPADNVLVAGDSGVTRF